MDIRFCNLTVFSLFISGFFVWTGCHERQDLYSFSPELLSRADTTHVYLQPEEVEQLDKWGDFYVKQEPQDSLFINIYYFYPNGILRRKGKYYNNVHGFPVGLQVDYTEEGEIESIIDHEEEYPYPLEDILGIMRKENLPLHQLRRGNGMYTYDGYFRFIRWDGQTGKVLVDIYRFTGYY